MTTWTLPRESVELIGPITVDNAGAAVTAFEVAVAARETRPQSADWSAPLVVEAARYVLVGPGTTHPLGAGVHKLWVRYAASPETPVLDDVGTIIVT